MDTDDFHFKGDKPQSVVNLTIPIWAVWAIVVTVASGAFVSAGILFNINAKLDASWSFPEMREYAAEAERLNRERGMQVPDIYEIRRKTR